LADGNYSALATIPSTLLALFASCGNNRELYRYQLCSPDIFSNRPQWYVAKKLRPPPHYVLGLILHSFSPMALYPSASVRDEPAPGPVSARNCFIKKILSVSWLL